MANEHHRARDIFAFESVSVAASAIGLTASVFEPADRTDIGAAQYAFITIETNSIRWQSDGTNPTDTVGHLATTSTTIEMHGIQTIRNFRAIQQVGGATLRVSYGR